MNQFSIGSLRKVVIQIQPYCIHQRKLSNLAGDNHDLDIDAGSIKGNAKSFVHPCPFLSLVEDILP
jgi:hypothetical protein